MSEVLKKRKLEVTQRLEELNLYKKAYEELGYRPDGDILREMECLEAELFQIEMSETEIPPKVELIWYNQSEYDFEEKD